jgi:hypothetical protein
VYVGVDPKLPRRRRLLTIALAALLTSACGTATLPPGVVIDEHGHGTAPTTTATSDTGTPAPFRTVDQLAATVGCTATLEGTTSDFRQATCMKDDTRFVFVDFDTTEGQRAWLDYATSYGGEFLVGDRWAMSGKDRDYLEGVRAKLGGAIEGGNA